MPRTRSINRLAGAVALPLVALAIVGCGGDDDESASTAPPQTPSGRTATVGVADTDLGSILVDSRDRTLYLFKKDSGTTSTCFGECATDWPNGQGLTAFGGGWYALSAAGTQVSGKSSSSGGGRGY
jgi:predicted lipoprotein with Yx(FWY)xxD motif